MSSCAFSLRTALLASALSAGGTIALAVVRGNEFTAAVYAGFDVLPDGGFQSILLSANHAFEPWIERKYRIQEPFARYRAMIFFSPERIEYVARTILRQAHASIVVSAFLARLRFDFAGFVDNRCTPFGEFDPAICKFYI